MKEAINSSSDHAYLGSEITLKWIRSLASFCDLYGDAWTMLEENQELTKMFKKSKISYYKRDKTIIIVTNDCTGKYIAYI